MEPSVGLLGQLFAYFCLGFLVLIFIGGGIYFLLRSNRDREKARQSLNWPSTSGRVLESRLVESTSTDSEGDTSTTYRAHVKYEYDVMGSSYTNDKIDAGMVVSTSSINKHQEILNRYPEGSTVKVYYNPTDPADSMLEQRTSSSAALIFGVLLLVAGLCLILPVGLILLLSFFTGG